MLFYERNTGWASGYHQLSTIKVKVAAREGSLPAHTDGETLSTQAVQLRMELKANQIELMVKPA